MIRHQSPTHTHPLASSPLFARCSRKELTRLGRLVDRIESPAGAVIAREGTNPHAVYLIVRGHVTLSRDGQPFAEAGPGEHFGEVSVLTGSPLAVTAAAGTDVELIEIGQREFVAAVDTMPSVARRVLRDLANGDLRDLASGVRPVALAA
jgi:CRP-like cAMP-binding protein